MSTPISAPRVVATHAVSPVWEMLKHSTVSPGSRGLPCAPYRSGTEGSMPCSARSRRNTARAATKRRRRDSGIAAARARSSSVSDPSAAGEISRTSKQASAETGRAIGVEIAGMVF
jgi:hypothetical protein